MEQAVCKDIIKKGRNLLFAAALSAVVTVVGILLFAFVIWKAEIPATAENVGLIIISVISCFLSGLFVGKKNRERRFLWGLAAGIIYFLVLLVLRISFGDNPLQHLTGHITTLLYCAASGILGGMLS